MKKNMKTIATVVLSVLLLWCACIPAYASDANAGVAPCLDNAYDASMAFVVIDPGVANFMVSYNGNPDTFTVAKLTVTFEKRFLGIFWRTVDIGTENNEWVAYCYDLRGDFYDNVTMDGTGTYRANFKLEIMGGGSVDVIEETMQCQYP